MQPKGYLYKHFIIIYTQNKKRLYLQFQTNIHFQNLKAKYFQLKEKQQKSNLFRLNNYKTSIFLIFKQKKIIRTANIFKTKQQTNKKRKNITLNYKTGNFFLQNMGIFVFCVFLTSTIVHQISQGVFEYWSHTFILSLNNLNYKPLFIIGDYKQTLAIIFIFLSFFNILRSFMLSYASTTTSQKIFNQIIRNTIYAKIKIFEGKYTVGMILQRMFDDISFLDDLQINYFFIVFFNLAQLVFILTTELYLMFIRIKIQKYIYIYIYILYIYIQFIFQYKNIQLLVFPYSQLIESYNMKKIKYIKINLNNECQKNTYINKYIFNFIQKSKIAPFYLSNCVDYLSISIVLIIAFYQANLNTQSFNPSIYSMALAYSYRMIGCVLNFIIQYFFIFVFKIRNALRSGQNFKIIEKVIERTREYCEEKNEFREIDINKINQKSNKFNYLIEYSNVFLQYNENQNFALNDVSFQIQKGQKVAFCGRTGSGKTSIINSLLKLYDINKGEIILKDSNIKYLSLKELRDNFSVIPQNGFLFQGKLRDNIDPMRNYCDNHILQYFNDLNIQFERIKCKENLLDFEVEKAGNNLSNGEKQIVNFLQSVIQEKEIIILDEATSNMDPLTNDKIMKFLLDKICFDKTLILVSHRLDNLKDFDVIFVMENEKKIIQINGELAENPFYVPEDTEILKMKEKEKETRMHERQKNENLKIWEKGIKNKGTFTVGKLNELYKIEEEYDDENLTLNIVDAAKNAIKNRVKQKEPMHQFIEKKREMLLFQMLIDHKREQINQFEEQTRLHKRGLEKSEQMLDEDMESFNKFLEENKNSSRQAIKAAEDETKKKQEKIAEIKNLLELKADLTTRISQKLENLEEMWGQKSFLDQITPKEYIEEQLRQNKLKREISQRSKSQKNNTSEIIRGLINNLKPEIQQLLNESDEEFEPYFKRPEQLDKIFIDLQEKNLSLIQNTQDLEQMAEEIKHRYQKRQKILNEEKNNRIQAKNELQKSLDQVNEQIKRLKQIKNDNQAPSQLAQIESEIHKIYKNEFLAQEKNADIRKDISGIEMLKEMEKKLENQIKDLKFYRQNDPKRLQEQERICTGIRRENIKQSLKEQEKKEQEQRKREQDLPQKEKRYGRPIMAKSLLQKQEKEEKVVEEEPEEEKERKQFFM
ncbi:hypothetical protein IMG5_109730 [Ichthyophthirius multifiliis]|uniref:Uncharacterized protein n=1 Tax=Ichthyophthirius multifiliis TaxID=5932 RepID=G0QTM0_ICHMU|nr:hypothetical protein IMG5_109730 [Ichthyophthirius multifiliis]EGR31434.1 hypothetical protein IMG5_109730 [Ichthyophthirius multifiliis]|eukprot:XP_004034920.1 hypothetical protein IMG5_109730 [Ichthyophthirius multifiliis]